MDPASVVQRSAPVTVLRTPTQHVGDGDPSALILEPGSAGSLPAETRRGRAARAPGPFASGVVPPGGMDG